MIMAMSTKITKLCLNSLKLRRQNFIVFFSRYGVKKLITFCTTCDSWNTSGQAVTVWNECKRFQGMEGYVLIFSQLKYLSEAGRMGVAWWIIKRILIETAADWWRDVIVPVTASPLRNSMTITVETRSLSLSIIIIIIILFSRMQ